MNERGIHTMSAIIEYPDLESLKMAIIYKDNHIVTDLNMNTTDTYAKANGYTFARITKNTPAYHHHINN